MSTPSAPAPYIEPWLNGSHAQVPAAARAVLHALDLALDDLNKWTAGLSDADIVDVRIGSGSDHTEPAALNAALAARKDLFDRIAKKLGASHLINYKKAPDWGKEVFKVVSTSACHRRFRQVLIEGARLVVAVLITSPVGRLSALYDCGELVATIW